MERSQNDTFIGFLVEEAVDDCLRLQALLQRTSKGAIVRDIVVEYGKSMEWTVEDLIERYSTHLYSQWDLRWRDKHSFTEYIAEHQVKMKTKHKLPDRLIISIIEKCKEKHRLNQ